MEGEMKRLIKVWLSVLASLCYCYFLTSKIPKGKLRLLSLFPILYLFTALPLSLTTVLPTGVTAFFITWLANFKLLLFAFGLGPLASHPPNSLLLFISTACLPIKIKKPFNSPPNLDKGPKLPLNLGHKTLLFGILVIVYDNYKHRVPQYVLPLLYSCMMYLFIDIVLGVSNAVVRTILRIELELPSDEPYFSTSLQNFWGRRWNLMVTDLMRHTVYKPVRAISEIVIGSLLAPLPAVLAAFTVSGLMHELVFFYVTRASPTWEVTWFFVLQGVCVVVEFGVKRTLTDTWQLHWMVSGPLTVAFVVLTAKWLFYPPLVRNGADVIAIEECKFLMEFVRKKLKMT